MLYVAIIGGGYIADCHVTAYHSIGDTAVKVSAVVDANPTAGQAMAQKAGCSWYETLEAAVQAEIVDVVDVCVPTFLHEMFTVKAAQLGKHVLCEKPVTLTLESFDRMWDACRQAGVKFMTGQVVRFFPEFDRIREVVRSGQLGKIHMFSEKRLCQHPAWTTWHRDPNKSGGGLFDLNTHDIDYIYSLFGMPERVSAVGWRNETGCWNHVVTILQWEQLQAVCETSLEMTGEYPFSVGVRAVGDGGTLEYSSSAGANIKEQEALTTFRYYPEGQAAADIQVEAWDPFRRELEGFLLAVEQDSEVPVPPEQTRDVLRILMATKASLQTNQTVVIGDNI